MGMAVKTVAVVVVAACLTFILAQHGCEARASPTLVRSIVKNREEIQAVGTSLNKQHALLPPLITSVCDAKQTRQQTGIYRFKVKSVHNQFSSFCDMTTDGGRWLVFQRRMHGAENFYRKYADYTAGFGERGGEFWLGLETLYRLTSKGNWELRVDFGDWAGNYRYAKYSTFKVASSGYGYQLTVGGYSGTAGDSFSYHSGSKFTTYDKDQDSWGSNCATRYKGAWWYKSCHYSNLNGLYKKGKHSSFADGVNWYHWKGYHYSLKFTEMKIRLK